jgi:hypothetical protein
LFGSFCGTSPVTGGGGADGAHAEPLEPQLLQLSQANRLRNSRWHRLSRQPLSQQLSLHVVVQPVVQQLARFRSWQRKPQRFSQQLDSQQAGPWHAGAWHAGACSHTVTGTMRGRLTQTSSHTW